jgi:hypothetical protein
VSGLRVQLESGVTPAPHEEAYGSRSFTDDDIVAVTKRPSVDVNDEFARGQARQRAPHAALKFVDRRAFADCFTHGQRKKFANANRRHKRKRCRTGGGYGMKIDRYANANHREFIWRIFEEPPAPGEYRIRRCPRLGIYRRRRWSTP